MEIKFSAVAVTYNESAHLDDCLKALNFCDEKIVIDLGSSDNSIEIAKKNGAQVFNHERVEMVELIREYAVSLAKNDWIFFIDPDMTVPENIINDIIIQTTKYSNVGIILIPFYNLFLGKRIRFGRWGGNRYYPAIINKKRVVLQKELHNGFIIKDGYKTILLSGEKTKHYWTDTIEQFYEKHNRYLKHEGQSRYNQGYRFSYFKMYYALFINFFLFYFRKLGILDMKNGIKLIKLALWYEKNSWLSLKKFQENK